MKCPAASALFLSVALGLAATPASAQESTNPIEKPASATVAPATTQPVRKRAQRAISSEVAASLAAAMPEYNPPEPAPPPKPVEEQPDLREVDKPKNTIIRLPDYVVREAKPPVFRERDINTKAGMANIAMKKYGTRRAAPSTASRSPSSANPRKTAPSPNTPRTNA